MNEIDPAHDAPQSEAGRSEAPSQDTARAQSSVGAVLRAAREAQGWSVQEVATRLRLMNRQIVAMEEDDFALLGQPVFARGFVRNYARVLQLDPATVLQKMGGERVEPREVKLDHPVEMASPWFNPSWLIIGAAVALLLIAVPVGLYFWLNSGEDDEVASRRAVTVNRTPSAQPRTATHSTTTPATTATPVAAASLPATSQPVPDAAPPLATSGAPLVAAQATSSLPVLPPPASAPVAAARVSAPTPVGAMHFDFADDAWVEIRDSTGKLVHRQMDRAGSSADVSGLPPFNLVIGNAARVSMTYNGRPLDIKPFIDITVARFTLEQ
jgi:cytoskeleton protein RodZ